MAETKLMAEIAGRIISISHAQGDRIQQGEEVVVIESMKMEIPLTAQITGIVKAILVQIDDMVEEGQALLIVET
jgi:biotin carboxyl carrier protein